MVESLIDAAEINFFLRKTFGNSQDPTIQLKSDRIVPCGEKFLEGLQQLLPIEVSTLNGLLKLLFHASRNNGRIEWD